MQLIKSFFKKKKNSRKLIFDISTVGRNRNRRKINQRIVSLNQKDGNEVLGLPVMANLKKPRNEIM